MAEFAETDLEAIFAAVPEPAPKERKSKKADPALTPEMKKALRAAAKEAKEAKAPDGDDPGDDATGDTKALKVAGLRAQIRAYQEHPKFSEVLKAADYSFPAALRKKTPRELRRELRRIDNLLVKKSGSDPVDMGVHALLSVGETLGKTAGYKIEGLADACLKNDSWVYTLERLKCKYGWASVGSSIDPLLALAMATGKTAITLHVANSQKDELKPMMAQITSRLDEPMPGADDAGPKASQAGPIPGAAAPGMLKADGSPRGAV